MALFQRKKLLADLETTLNKMSKDRATKDIVAQFRGLKGRRQARTALAMLADDVESAATFHTMEDEPVPPREFPLLKWLWEHREEIIAFIIRIIGLFSQTAK